MLSLRNATEADLGEIRRIYEYAQDYMIGREIPPNGDTFIRART